MKKILFAIAFLYCAVATIHAQDEIVIPYEMVGGKMCVDMSINDVPYRFIFDTGGQTMILESLKNKLGLHFLDSINVTDATSIKKAYARFSIDKATFNNSKYIFRHVPTLIMGKENKTLDCFNVVGIIGNDVISRFILQIDPGKKLIRMLPLSSKINISLRNMVKFEPNKRNMPIFTIGLASGETLKVLFDTGSKSFLSLQASDFEELQGTPALEVTHKGKGHTSIGISGNLDVQDVNLANLPLVSVGASKFGNVTTTSSQVPISLLGTALLQYGKVTIDYGRTRFYFEPFEKKTIAQAGEKTWNVGLIAENGTLKIASLWDDMNQQAGIGDEVLKIDGQDVPRLDFCEPIINGIDLLKNKDKAELTIKSEGRTKVISIKKI